jgi:hypothetical protein
MYVCLYVCVPTQSPTSSHASCVEPHPAGRYLPVLVLVLVAYYVPGIRTGRATIPGARRRDMINLSLSVNATRTG